MAGCLHLVTYYDHSVHVLHALFLDVPQSQDYNTTACDGQEYPKLPMKSENNDVYTCNRMVLIFTLQSVRNGKD